MEKSKCIEYLKSVYSVVVYIRSLVVHGASVLWPYSTYLICLQSQF